jgi:hypothetical protein
MKLLVCVLSPAVGCTATPEPEAEGVTAALRTALAAVSTGVGCVCCTAVEADRTVWVCVVALETVVVWLPVVVPALADLCEWWPLPARCPWLERRPPDSPVVLCWPSACAVRATW